MTINSDLDLVLVLALMRKLLPAQSVKKHLKHLIKRLPHNRRPAINLLLTAKNPNAVIAQMLKDMNDEPLS